MERKWLYGAIGIVAIAIVVWMGYNLYLQTTYPTITTIKNKAVFVIGTSADFPPFEYVNETGAIVGLDIDIANEIAKELGVKLEIKDLGFASLITALENKQIDSILAGMTITAERQQKVDFSKPYFNASQAVISLAGKSIGSLTGKKIGVQVGTTGEWWVADNLIANGTIPEDNVIHYDKWPAAILALQKGDVDVLLLDEPVGKMFVKKISGLQYNFAIDTGEQYGIAVNKESKDLLELVNKVISNLQTSGKYESIVEKWFGS